MVIPRQIEKRNEHVLAILSFHKIGDPGPGGWNSWFYIPEKTFAGHLRYLKDNGWNVIDMTAFLAGLRASETLPERAALLTFDDGYRSVREVALPWLRRFGYPAVSFVSTGYIGGWSTFDSGIEPEEPICDWEDLRYLQDQGISIQSHGVTHRGFSSLGPQEQEEELKKSKNVLERKLRNSIEVFAYPYGDHGGDPREIARKMEKVGFRGACIYGGGVIPLPMDNAYCLPRIAMGPDTDLEKELVQK